MHLKCLIWIFLNCSLEKYCHIWRQHSTIFRNAKFFAIKGFKFWTKNVLFWCFWAVILKTIGFGEISTLEFFKMQSFVQNKKKSNLAAKMFYLGIFRLKFEKNYCHIWNQHPEILQNINLCRIPIHALFGCVLFAILKNFCHIWNQYPRFCQKWIVNFALSLKVRLWFRVGFLKYADIRVELFNCCKDSPFHIQ